VGIPVLGEVVLDEAIETRCRQLAVVLMGDGFESISVSLHPHGHAVLFYFTRDDRWKRGAMLPLWKIKQQNNLKLVENLRDQLVDKKRR
jgi:hypothetical protein